jgi:CrcB protein
MSTIAAVFVGGALGALSRYGLDRLIEQRGESSFPWSTFAINVSGCVLVGFLIAAIVDRHSAPDWLRAGLVVGFCGGYTTFSTFAQETLDLVEAREVVSAALSVSANVVLGVLAVVAGARLARFT